MKNRVTAIIAVTLLTFCAAVAQTPARKSTHGAVSQSRRVAPADGQQAIIHTSLGDIHCTIFTDTVPQAAANFIGLATGTKEWTDPATKQKKTGVPLYDGTTFHRVIPGFMIQGGDPLGTGEGDGGFSFKDEYDPSLKFNKPGMLAYANSGPNTNGSQFFITETAQPHLNPCLDDEGCIRGGRAAKPLSGYTIFGQCGQPELVQKIARVERDSQDKPKTPVVITHIEIVGFHPAKTIKKAVAKTAVKKVVTTPVNK